MTLPLPPLRLALLAALLAAVAPTAAGAMPLCQEGTDDVDVEEELALAMGGTVQRVIAPCALAESALASSCADAAFYVVTPAGTLLCQVDLALLSTTSTKVLDRAPPSGVSSSAGPGAHAVVPEVHRLPPRFGVELPAAAPAPLLTATDGHLRRPPVPS